LYAFFSKNKQDSSKTKLQAGNSKTCPLSQSSVTLSSVSCQMVFISVFSIIFAFNWKNNDIGAISLSQGVVSNW